MDPQPPVLQRQSNRGALIGLISEQLLDEVTAGLAALRPILLLFPVSGNQPSTKTLDGIRRRPPQKQGMSKGAGSPEVLRGLRCPVAAGQHASSRFGCVVRVVRGLSDNPLRIQDVRNPHVGDPHFSIRHLRSEENRRRAQVTVIHPVLVGVLQREEHLTHVQRTRVLVNVEAIHKPVHPVRHISAIQLFGYDEDVVRIFYYLDDIAEVGVAEALELPESCDHASRVALQASFCDHLADPQEPRVAFPQHLCGPVGPEANLVLEDVLLRKGGTQPRGCLGRLHAESKPPTESKGLHSRITA
mmetsp:Transcript_43149/g.94053  ORF Transcript_43149/g.94053 Transcript_43149/m.94053 type:complete len:301 (-) Transcript_43149:8-910(-)